MDKIWEFQEMSCQGALEETFDDTIKQIEAHFLLRQRANMPNPRDDLAKEELIELTEFEHEDHCDKIMATPLKSVDVPNEFDVSDLCQVETCAAQNLAVGISTSSADPTSVPEWTGFVLNEKDTEAHRQNTAESARPSERSACELHLSTSSADPTSVPEWTGFVLNEKDTDTLGQNTAESAGASERSACELHQTATTACRMKRNGAGKTLAGSANISLSERFHDPGEAAIVAVLTNSPKCSIISDFERGGPECLGPVNFFGVGMREEVDLSDPWLVQSLVDRFSAVGVSCSWADPVSFPEWPGFRKCPCDVKGVMGGNADGLSAADGAAALGHPVCNVHERAAAHARKRRCTAGPCGIGNGGGEGGGAGGEGVCMGAATVSATTGAQAAEAAPKQIRVSIRHFTGRRCAVALQRVRARLDSVPLFPTEYFVGIVHVVKFGVRNAAEAVAAGEEATTTAMVITLQAEYVTASFVRFTINTLEPCEAGGGSNSKLRDIVSPPKLQLRQVNQTKGLGVGLKHDVYGAATPGSFLVMQDVAVKNEKNIKERKESICLSSQ
jgi:hypothetical protein